MHGVRGRFDLFGVEVLPLREQDVRDAGNALLDDGVEGIVISLLFCYRNPAHERARGEIVDGGQGAARRERRGSGLRLLRALPDAGATSRASTRR